MPRRIRPGRLRRRLAIAFILVAGISAGVLALGSYLLVRQARLADSLDRAQTAATFQLVLAGRQFLPLTEDHIAALKDAFEQRDQHVVLVTNGNAIASNPSFDPPIASELRGLVEAGRLGYERLGLGGHHILLVGGKIPGSAAALYFITLEDRIDSDLTQLRSVLLIGWVAVLVIAGLVGRLLAKRTLEPVARASDAARSIAEGLLATRLPVGGQDEFGAWAASFNEMAEALETKISALSEAQARERRFTADVAHELRTPLTALVGEASLLADHLDAMPAASRRPAELLIADVGRLRRLVEDLMEISRFDAGRESVQAENVDLGSLTAGAIRARGWEGNVRLDTEDVVITSDPRRLERI